jgi:uncharacterized protein (DUF885 family)
MSVAIHLVARFDETGECAVISEIAKEGGRTVVLDAQVRTGPNGDEQSVPLHEAFGSGPYHRRQSGLVLSQPITNRWAMPVTFGGVFRGAKTIICVALIAGCAHPTVNTGTPATPATDAMSTRVRAIADEVVALAQSNAGIPRFSRSQLDPSALSRWDSAVDRWLAELKPMKLDQLVGRPEWVILGVMREGLEASVALRTCSERPTMKDACYAAIARSSTTLPLTATDLLERGTAEQRNIDPELMLVAGKLFGVTTANEAKRKFRTDSRYAAGTREEVLRLAEADVARSRAPLSSWFLNPPTDTLIIRPETPAAEANSPGGRYVRANTNDGVANLIINTYKPEEQNRANVLNAVVHEGYPGHHLQISIERRAPAQHFVLRLFSPTSFIEGWAFYAERLSDEMGVYATEMERTAFLVHLTDGAMALRADAALNTGRWTKEQAIDTMMIVAGRQRWQAEVYANRHLNTAGQTVSYMVGYRVIMDLRDRARRQLGAKFDIRAFHAQILNDGPVTMPMLTDKIERWIATTAAGR